MRFANVKAVKHAREEEIRKMILDGANMQMLKTKCMQWKVSEGTARNYIKNAADDVQRMMDRSTVKKETT